MRGLLLRALITAVGLWAAAAVLPGVEVAGMGTLAVAALLMGVVNALLRPLLVILTLPLTVLTLGLFLLVLNAALFALVAAVLPGFRVAGFFSALFGWLIVSLVGGLANYYVGPQGRYQVLVVRRRW